MSHASRAPRPVVPIPLTVEQTQRFGAGEAIVIDGLLGTELAAGVAAELPHYLPDLAPTRMGRGAARWMNRAERGDEIAWIDPESAPPAVNALARAFEQLRVSLNRAAYLGLRRFDVQVARYRRGARYARHADAFKPRFGVSRRATAIYYANPDWTLAHGGALRAYGSAGAVDIAPLLDRLVLFCSEQVEHEVLPCFAERWAVTAWFYTGDGR